MNERFIIRKITGTVGDRIRLLRTACQLSRRQFSERNKIPEPTLRAWELNLSKISTRSLAKVVHAFHGEGIDTSSKWILTGLGDKPYAFEQDNNPKDDNGNRRNHEQNIEKIITMLSLDTFHRVLDDCNHPFLKKGDYVAGHRVKVDDIVPSNEQLYILYTDHNGHGPVVRKIHKKYKNNLVDLASFNLNASIELSPIITKTKPKDIYLIDIIYKSGNLT